MIRKHSKKVVTFGWVWLNIGFAFGTLVLLGPSRWLTLLVRSHGWEQRSENVLMWGVIGLYLVTSFLLALWITRFLLQYRARAAKAGVMSVVTAVGLVALWGWTNPGMYAAAAGGTESVLTLDSGARFIFGPYPDHERLQALQAEGVTGVISLQHPAVVPFEPEGIAHERQSTSELGIRFVSAPMLPWVSDNRAALDQIREIVRKGEGVWYVHCGLGRDRVNVVRTMIESMGGAVKLVRNEAPRPLQWGDRASEGIGPMERGEPIELDAGVWLVPFPNEHEVFGHMLAGQVATAVLLLDPSEPEQRDWIGQLRATLEEAGVKVVLRPLPASNLAAADRIALEVLDFTKPVAVVAPRTAPKPDAEVADAFERSWKQIALGSPPRRTR